MRFFMNSFYDDYVNREIEEGHSEKNCFMFGSYVGRFFETHRKNSLTRFIEY